MEAAAATAAVAAVNKAEEFPSRTYLLLGLVLMRKTWVNLGDQSMFREATIGG